MGVLEDAEFTITFHDDTLTQTTAAKGIVYLQLVIQYNHYL